MNPWENKTQNEQNPDNSHTETPQTFAESGSAQGAQIRPEDSSDTPSEHYPDTSLHKKCALCVHKNSLPLARELELVIKAWPDLSVEARGKIMSIISKKEEKQ